MGGRRRPPSCPPGPGSAPTAPVPRTLTDGDQHAEYRQRAGSPAAREDRGDRREVARPQSYELLGPLATRLLDEPRPGSPLPRDGGDQRRVRRHRLPRGRGSINQLMVARAREVIVVADSSELGRHAFARICPITEVAVLVTDSAADEASTAPFTAAGIRVIRA